MQLTALLLASILLPAAYAAAAPAAGKTVAVELGKQFRLKKGEIARIAGTKASLRIERFINSPCPKGAQCIWSGQSVVLELSIDGKVVRDPGKDSPYDITPKDSDYVTYADIVIDDAERACARPENDNSGECLRGLSRRRKDPGLCRKISNARTRGFCLEDMAEERRQDDLCLEVASPTQHCLYVKAKKTGNLAACDDIVTRAASVRCIKELSKEGGGGPGSCADLPPEPAKRCREMAAGPNN